MHSKDHWVLIKAISDLPSAVSCVLKVPESQC